MQCRNIPEGFQQLSCKTRQVKADTMHISNGSRSSVLHLERNKLYSYEACIATVMCGVLAANLVATLGKTHIIASGDLLS